MHVQFPASSSASYAESLPQKPGDVFVFPSGTVVAWDVAEDTISTLISKGLLPAAENTHIDRMETEDLPYVEDPSKNKSSVIGEQIRLGTRQPGAYPGDDSSSKLPPETSAVEEESADHERQSLQHREANLVLDKIAFSSGLARSVKIAVLESALERYFESTRSIPGLLSEGSKLPFTRDFILRKTGELLTVRAQLNLYFRAHRFFPGSVLGQST